MCNLKFEANLTISFSCHEVEIHEFNFYKDKILMNMTDTMVKLISEFEQKGLGSSELKEDVFQRSEISDPIRNPRAESKRNTETDK